MTRGLVFLAALFSCGVSHGALLTNFSASYAKYRACSATMPASKCYKCYFDPEGISEGQVIAYVDVPDPGPGQFRFDFGSENGVKATHPAYTASVVGTPTIVNQLGRQRYEAVIQFSVIGPSEPPAGPVTIFEYDIHDAKPELGITDINVGFEFRPGNFITIFNPGPPPTFTTFDDTQLADVPLVLQVPEPGSLALLGWAFVLRGWTIARRGRTYMICKAPSRSVILRCSEESVRTLRSTSG